MTARFTLQPVPGPAPSHRRRGHGASDEWLTPPWLLAALGRFDLDPCAPVARPWSMATTHFTREDNGLIRAWFGRVWLNPPFSAWARWIARLAEHGAGTALLPARTDTRAFHAHVFGAADGLFLLRGRIDFHRPDGSPSPRKGGADFPVALVAYGEDDLARLADAGLDGRLILLTRRAAIMLPPSGSLPPTWRELVAALLMDAGGRAALPDLYARVAPTEKARGAAHWRAKVRQVVQGLGFRRVERGVYELAEGVAHAR